MREHTEESNFILALTCGLLTALALVVVWAYATYLFKYQIGWMAVGVGYIISFVVRFVGKGRTKVFGVLGSVLSLLACVGGNIFFIVICIANQEKMPIFEVLQQVPFSYLMHDLKDTCQAVDLVFYGIALYEGYTLSLLPLEINQSTSHSSL